jgi:hypothetical protein
MNSAAYKLGNILIKLSAEQHTRLALSAVIGAIGSGIESIAHHSLLSSNSLARFAAPLDTAAIGIFVFLLTYVETSAVRERRIRVVRDLRTVEELNHNVRNALETIQYAAYTSSDRRNMDITMNAVDRIDRILRELYPVLSPPQSSPPKA